MNQTITTRSGYQYIYSPALGTFLLSPGNAENKEYAEKKYAFLREYGILEKEQFPNMDTVYETELIESHLANLSQLLIEVTDDCNLACRYCSYGELYSNHDIREGKKQSFQNAKVMIDYLCNFWKSHRNISFDNVISIGFFGGEPLLNFRLIQQIIDYTESLDLPYIRFEYNITTNSLLLSKYMDYLAEKGVYILLSLDGSKENNGYRVTKTGEEAFEIINANILQLKEKHPEYFNTHINFNAVLHNKNSVVDIYEYIQGTFDKVPRITELNGNGISNTKKDEFNTMFTKKDDSIRQAVNCEYVNIDELITDNRITQLNIFSLYYSGSAYKTLPDLFFSTENLRYYPTGTCPPFQKKIYLTVQGKLLPCEKIGHDMPLGHIENGQVSLDMENVKNIYTQLYNPIVDKCKQCLLWKTCEICVYFLPKDEKGETSCPYFIGEEDLHAYFSGYLSAFEKDPDLSDRLTKEILY